MPLNPKKIVNDPKSFVRKIAVHSASGAGKTVLGAQLQDVLGKPIYLLDADGGTATLMSRGDIDSEETRRSVDVERVVWAFLNKEPDTLKYGGLMFDGIAALIKREFQEMTVAKGKEATWKEYGKTSTLATRLIQLIRDLPLTVVVNTWSRSTQPKIPGTDKVDENAPYDIKPDIPGGAYNIFMGSMDDVWHLAVGKDGTRYLYTDQYEAGGNIVHAKMRDPAVKEQFMDAYGEKRLPIIKSPNWKDLFARYQAAYGVKK